MVRLHQTPNERLLILWFEISNEHNNPESFRFTENIPILTSLGIRDTAEMASVLPDAMPYKTLARGHRSDLVPQSNWRIRRRVSRITRHRPDLNHRLNITFISSDYTQRVITKAMEDYKMKVTEITDFQVEDLDFKLRRIQTSSSQTSFTSPTVSTES